MDNKVEKYKITPEMKKWQRKYRQVTKATDFLAAGINLKRSEYRALRSMYEEAAKLKESMRSQMPEPTKSEMAGQS